MTKKLWGGRFKKGLDPALRDFSYSLLVDSELFYAEIEVNRAYVKMLKRIKLLSVKEAARLLSGLDSVQKNWKPGDACLHYQKYEDIHSLIQSRLEEKVGAVAKKLHTGRSRNDLVVTSTRYYLKQQVRAVQSELTHVQKALTACAKKAGDAVMPGFTHLKKAQPILAAHHFLAYVEMLQGDQESLDHAWKKLDVLVLGSAALAGSALPLDRPFLAKELGFSKVSSNSLAAVSDRAFITEVLQALSLVWMHLSRFSEDMILWNSEAFQFMELDDAFATGSSLMPQKKNPDLFELIRGKSAVIFGELSTVLTLQKGLPLSYNRDLQDDKPGIFRALSTTLLALRALAPALQTMVLNKSKMAQATKDDGLYATDILEYLVCRKMPFSEAHYLVGEIVRYGSEQQLAFKEIPLKKWKQFSKLFDQHVFKLFDASTSVKAKKTSGSTNPAKVRAEIGKWTRTLAGQAKKYKSYTR